MSSGTSEVDRTETEVLIIGAGFAGLYFLHRLRQLGFDAQVVERGADVGGTWYWNRYPGARCDIESMEYSYSFDEDLQQEWEWSERYATQPEILRYLQHVADRFGLRDGITFDATVTSAVWDDDLLRWSVDTDDGTRWTARYLVLATGALSAINRPEIDGLASFEGTVLHTGEWPTTPVDLTGARVGIIGTGSSAMQAMPLIAEQAAQVTVFQRTPNYAVPANNRPLTDDERQRVKSRYRAFRRVNRQSMVAFGGTQPSRADSIDDVTPEEVMAEFERRWKNGGLNFLRSFGDLMMNPNANQRAASFLCDRIDDLVDDPEVARSLRPGHVVGCKRLGVQTGWFEAFNRPNVELVDLRAAPIERITSHAIVTVDRSFDVDVIVLATGFDALTGAVTRLNPVGRDARDIRTVWANGAVNHLGMFVPGFPNMFVVTGPGSPAPLTNVVMSIEHHTEWITDLLDCMRTNEHTVVEASPEAAEAWVAHVDGIAAFTLFPSCGSWYSGANIDGKPQVFMPLLGFPMYVAHCAQVATDGYPGLHFDESTR